MGAHLTASHRVLSGQQAGKETKREGIRDSLRTLWPMCGWRGDSETKEMGSSWKRQAQGLAFRIDSGTGEHPKRWVSRTRKDAEWGRQAQS